METKNQFVIYSRKSKFTGKGESIENQIELCRQYIASRHGEEAAEAALVYEDEGFSGGNLDRPQFKKMMEDSQKMNFSAIVVYRLDRISRNIGDFAKLIEELNERGIEFISIREQFDTTSPMGRAMMYIASVFSQLERETISERIRDNMHELAKTGRWLGGITPTGYESESVSSVTVDGRTKKACKLKIIPDEIQIVRTIFDKFIETGSLTKVDQYMLENQLDTKTGKSFSRFTIKGILSNPVYMIADEAAYDYMTKNNANIFSDKSEFDGKHGIMAYNRTQQHKGKTHDIKPISEWIVSVGGHTGVISGEKWVQVQNMLELNKSKSYRKPRSNVALLSGLLFCKDCGEKMRPKLSSRKNSDGELIYSYLCSTKERSRSKCCAMKNANGNMLDAMIVEEIKKLGSNSGDYAAQITQAKKEIDSDRQTSEAEISRIKEQLTENDAAIKRLVDTLSRSNGTTAEKYILEQIDELHIKGQALQKRLKESESAAGQHELSDIEFDLIKQMLSSFGDCVDDFSVEEKRAAIRTFIKKIVWDGENAQVYIFGSDDECDFSENLSESCENDSENCEPLGEYSK